MKMLKSDCEKAWLFDCKMRDEWLEAGLACFLPSSPGSVVFSIGSRQCNAAVPSRAVDKLGAVRIVNARLPLLD